jgi:hypothetical protein
MRRPRARPEELHQIHWQEQVRQARRELCRKDQMRRQQARLEELRRKL